MIADLLSWFISLFLDLISIVLNAIFGLFGDINLPVFDNFANILNSFWDFIFNSIGYVRSALLIDSFEWNLIITILSIKLLYKPAISLIKMFIGWFNKLKV